MTRNNLDIRNNLNMTLAPGDWVHHPTAPDWGKGQVQSVDGERVTVNFEHAGKQLILVNIAPLVAISEVAINEVAINEVAINEVNDVDKAER